GPVEVGAAVRTSAELPEQPAAVQVKREQASHEPATGFELCRAISSLGLAVFPRPQERRECESSLFSVRLIRSSSEISTRKFAQEKHSCHVLSGSGKKSLCKQSTQASRS